MQDIYRIMAVLKVETDIITSIAARPIGRAVILVIMYVETFKTKNIILLLVMSLNVTEVTLTDNFLYQSEFVDTDNIVQ